MYFWSSPQAGHYILNSCILNGHISTYIISLILPLGLQSLKYLLTNPFQEKFTDPCIRSSLNAIFSMKPTQILLGRKKKKSYFKFLQEVAYNFIKVLFHIALFFSKYEMLKHVSLGFGRI